ncbi:ABC transporter ATP-binding protein [Streptomyces sp. AcE210]|uniref:ABC transporter ATP-binding protein n=1 Tax=Streptomyces sp. AcE210 TaxID=2292703 RepID=UPI000E302DC1|nr:ABC transporter ATP-binding protein [Streptomyces sp. AcE210]RFC70675.1 ABC transporter ATP-binding protein [Streptomyces sp. AcE210]
MSSTAPPAPPDTLDIRDLTVEYGRSVRALSGVSLQVPAGGTVALLGANGSGKTTLMRAVSGVLALHGGLVRSGTISFGALPLTDRSSADIVAAGIVQVPEGRRVFADLSVEDNLRAGRLGVTGRSRAEARDTIAQIYELFPVLADRRRRAAGLLSGGEQQMLAMGRALMARPRLLLLDEPSLGLAPQMTERIAGLVRRIHEQGTGVLVVEQNAALALELADHACVLDVGRIRLAGPSEELSRTDEVRRLYLGESPDDEAGPVPCVPRQLARWTG